MANGHLEGCRFSLEGAVRWLFMEMDVCIYIPEEVLELGEPDTGVVRDGDDSDADALLEDVVLDRERERRLDAVLGDGHNGLLDLKRGDDLAALVDNLLRASSNIQIPVPASVLRPITASKEAHPSESMYPMSPESNQPLLLNADSSSGTLMSGDVSYPSNVGSPRTDTAPVWPTGSSRSRSNGSRIERCGPHATPEHPGRSSLYVVSGDAMVMHLDTARISTKPEARG